MPDSPVERVLLLGVGERERLDATGQRPEVRVDVLAAPGVLFQRVPEERAAGDSKAVAHLQVLNGRGTWLLTAVASAYVRTPLRRSSVDSHEGPLRHALLSPAARH